MLGYLEENISNQCIVSGLTESGLRSLYAVSQVSKGYSMWQVKVAK